MQLLLSGSDLDSDTCIDSDEKLICQFVFFNISQMKSLIPDITTSYLRAILDVTGPKLNLRLQRA